MALESITGPVVFVRWSLGDGWPVLEISDNVESVLGYSPTDLVRDHTPWASLIHPADLARLQIDALRLVEDSRPEGVRVTYRVRHTSGVWATVLEHVHLLEDPELGRVFSGYVLDISDVVRREEELEETRRLLEDVSSLARVGGWKIDLRTQSLEWSKVTREIHEVPDDYVPTLETALDFYAEGESRDRISEAVLRATQTMEGYDLELEIITWKGNRRWVRALGMVYYEGDTPVRLAGSFQDITDRKRAQHALEASEARLRFALEQAGDGTWELDAESRRVETSPRWEARLGFDETPGTFTLEDYLLRVVEDDRAAFRARIDACLAGESSGFEMTCRVLDAQDAVRHVVMRCRLLPGSGEGSPPRLIGVHADVTDAVLDEEARYRRLVRQLHEVVFRTDHRGRWTFLNPAWEKLSGVSVAASLGSKALSWVADEDRQPLVQKLFECLDSPGGEGATLECRMRRMDGSIRWMQVMVDIDHGDWRSEGGAGTEARGFVGSILDITEQRESAESVRILAYFDDSTGLHNRRYFLEALESGLAHREVGSPYVGLLLLDLDDFKSINDTLGHDAGDALLEQVGNRLRGLTTPRDVVARVGGDEFAILLPTLATEPDRAQGEVLSLSEEVVTSFRDPLLVSLATEKEVSFETHSSVSIGVVLAERGTPAHECLKHADLALYRSKAGGRNRWTLFEQYMQDELDERTTLSRDLREALDHGALSCALQGQFDVSGRMVGVEILARWQHPRWGDVAPEVFVPIAEKSGLIVGLGRWMLQRAISTLEQWSENPATAHLSLSVNVSVRELREPGFVAHVGSALAAAGVPPERLTLEMTESVFAEDAERVARTLGQLRALGVRLAIDDFGTGYSSLAYLKRFPIDELKIDRTFVRDLGQKSEDTQIVSAILMLAHALGLHVVAEGVENQEQLALLHGIGCKVFQGWLLHRPSDPAVFEEELLASAG